MLYDMSKRSDERVIARLDPEEQAILQRARALTGQNTSGVVKAALRAYGESLPQEAPLEIFERFGVVGAVHGPTDLSERVKDALDFRAKLTGHAGRR
jgi:hypothetical protein